MSHANSKRKYSGVELVQFQTAESQRRPGNKNAVRRPGLFSTRMSTKATTRRVTRLANRVWAALPWLEHSDEAIVRSWATMEILSAEVFAHMDREGLIDPSTGGVSRLLTEYRHLKNSLLKLEIHMGMTPVSRAQLGLTVAIGQNVDLASQIAAARAERAREVVSDGE